MSDPYNSYGASIPPVVPPVAGVVPGAVPRANLDPIARLDVSASWKRKFRLIDKAGGPDLPQFRDLPFGERLGVNFNVLGFLFGPFYFLAKGLWRQAVLYFIFALALFFVFEAMGLGKFARSIGYGLAAAYALRANVSYYRKVVLGDAPWL